MSGNFTATNLAHFFQALLDGSARPHLKSAILKTADSVGGRIKQLVASEFVEKLAEDNRDKLILLRSIEKPSSETERAFRQMAEEKAVDSFGLYTMDLAENEIPPEYEKALGTALCNAVNKLNDLTRYNASHEKILLGKSVLPKSAMPFFY
jgi:hypothetical protein